ncbi:MAG: hypothetical protein FWC76_03495 [Defluviitaleaceae bacterium]|nr:hypothetical protein [Defluviitaleaceae bacterium]
MLKKWAVTVIISSVILFLAACGNESANYPQADDYALIYEAKEVEEDQDVKAYLEMEISEHIRQAAEDFLSEFATIFTSVVRALTTWDEDEQIAIPTGSFWPGWDNESREFITVDEPPGIYFLRTFGGGPEGFFDQAGNQIEGAPYLRIWHGEDWAYASSFKLFDFDNSGIPIIFIFFDSVFEDGFRFYEKAKYIDGEYRLLETRAFIDGEETSPTWMRWSHNIFYDDTGRLITLHHSWGRHMVTSIYEHLIITDNYAELHLITQETWYNLNAWQENYWSQWGETPYGWGMIDSWLLHNPTIFGTDIPLTPMQSLASLEDEIMASILERLQPGW